MKDSLIEKPKELGSQEINQYLMFYNNESSLYKLNDRILDTINFLINVSNFFPVFPK